MFFCDEVKEALAKSRLSKKKLEKISGLTPENYTAKDMQLISNSLRKYTNAYQNKAGEKAPIGSIIKGLMTSPDYTMKDFKAIVINGYMNNTSLWKEITRINLTEQLKNVEIPYMILQGDTDIVASTGLVEELVANSYNSNLSCRVVANTGHMPGVEMMDTLLTTLHKI